MPIGLRAQNDTSKALNGLGTTFRLHAPATACHNWTYVPTRWSREQKPRVAYDIFLFYSFSMLCKTAKIWFTAAQLKLLFELLLIGQPSLATCKGKNSWLCTYALGREIQSQLTYGSNLLFTLCQAKWPQRLEAKKNTVQFAASLYGGQWLVLLLFWPNGSFMHLRRR